jgi:sulfate/thiosulfate transport system ATP-binding protein
MSIEIKDIAKNFGSFKALDRVNLLIPSGELVALLGPSGSGKTTLLRILAGLENPDSGRIFFSGRDATHDPARERRIGFVFQHYALFRHMTIFENVAYGLRIKPKSQRLGEKDIAAKVHELLTLVQLDWLADRYPNQLSGGQRQRIALARSLAVEPQVLLLDEPFGALDAKVRLELRQWLRRLHDDLGITSVFVTHDQEEAMEVADRVVILNEGRIVQEGTPEAVYDAPATPFVYEFLGQANLFTGHLHQEILAAGRDVRVTEHPFSKTDTAHAYVRPYDFEIALVPQDPDALKASIDHAQIVGNAVRLRLKLLGIEPTESSETLRAELDKVHYRSLGLNIGDTVYVRPKYVQVFQSAAPQPAHSH